jgi:hypothetical protein
LHYILIDVEIIVKVSSRGFPQTYLTETHMGPEVVVAIVGALVSLLGGAAGVIFKEFFDIIFKKFGISLVPKKAFHTVNDWKI